MASSTSPMEHAQPQNARPIRRTEAPKTQTNHHWIHVPQQSVRGQEAQPTKGTAKGQRVQPT